MNHDESGTALADERRNGATGHAKAAPAGVGATYDGSTAVYRLLRLEAWGSPLMNLGYYAFGGPLAVLNVLAEVPAAQHRLVLRSVGLLDVQPEHQVLDVACGRGTSSYILSCLHPQASVVGLDLVPGHVAAARTLYGNARELSYAAGDAMLLDYPDGSFDRLMCLEAAFHFPDRGQFLREAFRVLRPGGRLVVVDFAWNTDADRARRDDPETRLVRQIWHWEDFSSIPEYERLATRAGLSTSAREDWSSRVTRPIQAKLRCVSVLARSKAGRRFLLWKNPLFRSFSPADWEACTAAVSAHDHVQRHSKYMAFAFSKP